MRVIGRFMRCYAYSFSYMQENHRNFYIHIIKNAATLLQDRGVCSIVAYGLGVALGAGVAAGHFSLNWTVTSALTVS